MNKQTEALKLALEALEDYVEEYGPHEKDSGAAYAITAIREALAEQPAQQQEPVAWQILNGVCHAGIRSTEDLAKEAAAGMQKTHDLGGSLAAFHVRPLYTSPPASKPWVGLTQQDIDIAFDDTQEGGGFNEFARAIEAKLREKNGGKA